MKRPVLFGVAALLAVGLAAGGVLAMQRMRDDGVTAGGTSPETAFGIARPAVVPGGVELTVMNVDFDAWPKVLQADERNVPPNEGTRVVLVRLRAGNMGEEPVRVEPSDFGVMGTSRNFYGVGGADTGCGTVPEPLDAEVAPGQSVQGHVCVRLPGDETGLMLVWSPGEDSASERYFALGDPKGPPAPIVTLPPVREGVTVVVQNTQGCLNVRAEPSLYGEITGCLDEGTTAVIASGPTNADGYEWWELKDKGWAAGNWLAPAEEP